MLLNLKNLPLVEAAANVAREVGLQDVLEQLAFAQINSSHRHHVNALNTLSFFDAGREAYVCACRDFAEFMRPSPRHVELNVANLKICVLLQDPGPQLEVGHQERVEQHLVVDVVCLRLLEVFHHCLFNDIQEDTCKFIYAGSKWTQKW